MSHRSRRNPFRRSPKSPFDESGPNADALRRSLEWLERHDREVPFHETSVEIRKKSEQIPTEPPDEPTKPEAVAPAEKAQPEEALPETPDAPAEALQSEPAIQATETEPGDAKITAAAEAEPEPEAEAEAEPETQPTELEAETEVTTTELANIEEANVESAEVRSAIRPDRIRTIDRRRLPRAVDPEITDLEKHERKCCICQHPEREAIEEGFIQWRRTADLRYEFDLPNRNCIYRHAHAFGLFQKRNRVMRAGLENIIEESSHCVVTAESVIRAIRAHSCLDENGRWIEPPRRVIIARETLPKRRRRRRLATHH